MTRVVLQPQFQYSNDQGNQIRQHPRSRSGPRARVLHQETRVRGRTDQPFNDKQRWIELRIPGADTRVVLFTPPGQEDRIGSFQSVTFYSNDVKKTYDELSARGVEFVGPPQTADWGSSAIFKDQDGNQFVLSSK